MNEKGYSLAYEWDFGVDRKDFLKVIESTPKEMYPDLKGSSNDFVYGKDFQTDQFYFTQIYYPYRADDTAYHLSNDKYNVFYNKRTGVNHFFRQTTEGLVFDPLFFTDEYVLASLNSMCFATLSEGTLLEEKDKIGLRNYVEDSNPYLVKLYFK